MPWRRYRLDSTDCGRAAPGITIIISVDSVDRAIGHVFKTIPPSGANRTCASVGNTINVKVVGIAVHDVTGILYAVAVAVEEDRSLATIQDAIVVAVRLIATGDFA